MTRKQVDLEIEIDTYVGNYEDVIAVSNVHSLLDKIYADMAAQTCSGCKWWQDEICANSDSPSCSDFTVGEFVCSWWEEQDD